MRHAGARVLQRQRALCSAPSRHEAACSHRPKYLIMPLCIYGAWSRGLPACVLPAASPRRDQMLGWPTSRSKLTPSFFFFFWLCLCSAVRQQWRGVLRQVRLLPAAQALLPRAGAADPAGLHTGACRRVEWRGLGGAHNFVGSLGLVPGGMGYGSAGRQGHACLCCISMPAFP